MPTPGLAFCESMASTRLHAGQGPVLRGGFVMGGGSVGISTMPWAMLGRLSRTGSSVDCRLALLSMAVMQIQVEILAHGLGLPVYASAGAAGADLAAAVAAEAPVTLAAGARALVPTGIRLAVPSGYEAQIRPRSGLALRHGLALVNSPGTIDSDYRGEVQVLLINLGQEAVVIERGMRIAQMVIAPVTRAEFVAGPLGEDTVRGAGGFGSTGITG